MMKADTGVWRTLEGQGTSSAAQAAVVAGTEYSWDRAAFTQNASILWRTNHDRDSAQGFSGSVLCVGKTTDPTAKAAVFQNFESPIKQWQVTEDFDAWSSTFKGGFLLPEEIRQSIVLSVV